MESTYRTSQVAEMLGKSTSSIRKWAKAVEDHGGAFMRDERHERIYNEQDLAAFRHMKKLISAGRSTLDAGKQAATLLNNEREVRTQQGEILVQDDRQLIRHMAEQLDTLTQHLEQLQTERANEQREFQFKMGQILAKLNALDAPKEEAEEVEEQPKTGVFSRWFRK